MPKLVDKKVKIVPPIISKLKENSYKKNHILEIIGLPLLRLSTDGHSEKAKIIESLSNAMGHS